MPSKSLMKGFFKERYTEELMRTNFAHIKTQKFQRAVLLPTICI